MEVGQRVRVYIAGKEFPKHKGAQVGPLYFEGVVKEFTADHIVLKGRFAAGRRHWPRPGCKKITRSTVERWEVLSCPVDCATLGGAP